MQSRPPATDEIGLKGEFMSKNIKQLRAISYAYARKKEKEAQVLLSECHEKGLEAKEYKYPEITIRQCKKLLSK